MGGRVNHFVLFPANVPIRRYYAYVCLIWLVCAALAIMLWPVDALEIRVVGPSGNGAEPFFREAAPLGFFYRTRIIHSVQLTPVEDEYLVQEGRIWAWRERIMSHNAGLPSLPPERGRFLFEPPWMILEGTGESWKSILYRVGTAELGKNELFTPTTGWRNLWGQFGGQRLEFGVTPMSAWRAFYMETIPPFMP